MDDKELPAAGPIFAVGERVAFFPAELGPTSMWLGWDDAILDEVYLESDSFRCHLTSAPDESFGQGMENIVRRDERYLEWRRIWDGVFTQTDSQDEADAATARLWLELLAAHPLHGSDGIYRHPRLAGMKQRGHVESAS